MPDPQHPPADLPPSTNPEDDPFDPDNLRLVDAGRPIPERKVELACSGERRSRAFIPPMPLGWFQKACALPGKAAALGAVLWYLYRRNGSKPFRLTNASLERFVITRQAKYRALKALEAAGLISVSYRGKRSPEVTILTHQPPRIE
jgi:hypothetical protein